MLPSKFSPSPTRRLSTGPRACDLRIRPEIFFARPVDHAVVSVLNEGALALTSRETFASGQKQRDGLELGHSAIHPFGCLCLRDVTPVAEQELEPTQCLVSVDVHLKQPSKGFP